MIWSVLLTQHSMLHDLFTIYGKTSRSWIHLMPTVSPQSKISQLPWFWNLFQQIICPEHKLVYTINSVLHNVEKHYYMTSLNSAFPLAKFLECVSPFIFVPQIYFYAIMDILLHKKDAIIIVVWQISPASWQILPLCTTWQFLMTEQKVHKSAVFPVAKVTIKELSIHPIKWHLHQTRKWCNPTLATWAPAGKST